MKCISLWQPWASAVAIGYKAIETRGYNTNVRGRIGIHAALRFTNAQRSFWATRMDCFDEFLKFDGALPFGAIVCTAIITDSVPTLELVARGLSPQELAYGDYRPLRYGWPLADVVRLPQPIPWKGMQGFFNVPDSLFSPEALRGPEQAQVSLF